MKKDNSKYQLHIWEEVKRKSRAGVEYIKYIPKYNEVSKQKFYESFKR